MLVRLGGFWWGGGLFGGYDKTVESGGRNVVVSIVPPDISKADKPQGFGDRVPDSRQAANRSSKYIAN